MEFFSVPCAHCGKSIWQDDERCEACGEAVSAEQRAELQARAHPAGYHRHSKLVKSGRSALAYVILACGVGGILMFFLARSAAAPMLQEMQGMNPHTQLQHAVAGVEFVGDLRDVLERQPWEALIINLAVAAVMLRLWKRMNQTPGSALLSAFWIYLGASVLSLCLFPPNDVKDLIFLALKGYILVTLARGARAGLSLQRKPNPVALKS